MSCLLWRCTVKHAIILEEVVLLVIFSCATMRPPVLPCCSLLARGGPRIAPGNGRLLTWQFMHCLQVVWPAKDNISSVHPLLPCSHALVSNCMLGTGAGWQGWNQQEPCLSCHCKQATAGAVTRAVMWACDC